MRPSATADTCTHVHVLVPQVIDRKLSRIKCPTCQRRTFAVGWYAEWFGWSMTCLRCGERWNDGEQEPRPFRRGWRKDSIARAKRRWRAAPPESQEER